MPKAFEKCVADGGRVKTKKLSGGKYMHICFLGGKSFAGEVKTKEEASPGRAIMMDHEKRSKEKA